MQDAEEFPIPCLLIACLRWETDNSTVVAWSSMEITKIYKTKKFYFEQSLPVLILVRYALTV